MTSPEGGVAPANSRTAPRIPSDRARCSAPRTASQAAWRAAAPPLRTLPRRPTNWRRSKRPAPTRQPAPPLARTSRHFPLGLATLRAHKPKTRKVPKEFGWEAGTRTPQALPTSSKPGQPPLMTRTRNANKCGPFRPDREILSPLGAGGIGEVYRARDPRLGREVAIKVPRTSFSDDPDRMRRFEQEPKGRRTIEPPQHRLCLRRRAA